MVSFAGEEEEDITVLEDIRDGGGGGQTLVEIHEEHYRPRDSYKSVWFFVNWRQLLQLVGGRFSTHFSSFLYYISCRLAIFQLLDDIQSKSKELALASFSFGCVNVPIHLVS